MFEQFSYEIVEYDDIDCDNVMKYDDYFDDKRIDQIREYLYNKTGFSKKSLRFNKNRRNRIIISIINTITLKNLNIRDHQKY